MLSEKSRILNFSDLSWGSDFCSFLRKSHLYSEDKKTYAETDQNRTVNDTLNNRKNDWWVESGGPSVTNGGRIMTARFLNGNQIQFDVGDGDPVNAT